MHCIVLLYFPYIYRVRIASIAGIRLAGISGVVWHLMMAPISALSVGEKSQGKIRAARNAERN